MPTSCGTYQITAEIAKERAIWSGEIIDITRVNNTLWLVSSAKRFQRDDGGDSYGAREANRASSSTYQDKDIGPDSVNVEDSYDFGDGGDDENLLDHY